MFPYGNVAKKGLTERRDFLEFLYEISSSEVDSVARAFAFCNRVTFDLSDFCFMVEDITTIHVH
jgi:hypothetical protein